MSKKRLNVDSIKNELEGASLFFAKPKAKELHAPIVGPEITPPSRDTNISPLVLKMAKKMEETNKPTEERTKETKQETNHAIKLASYNDSFVETIRKMVKDLGKEVSFVRLTLEEKNKLTDIVYTYKRRGVKTSENEINRIAINFLLEDYKAHGQESLLSKVITALNS